jgi:hypothetical protein
MRNGWRLPNRAAFLVSQIFNLVLNQQATALSPLSDKTKLLQDNIKQWNVAVVTVDIKPRPAEIPWNTGPTIQAIKRRYIMSQLGERNAQQRLRHHLKLWSKVLTACVSRTSTCCNIKSSVLCPHSVFVDFVPLLKRTGINSNRHTCIFQTQILFVLSTNTRYIFRAYWPSSGISTPDFKTQNNMCILNLWDITN